MSDTETVTLGGVITAVRVKKTTKGRNIGFVGMRCEGGEVEAFFFPDLMERYGDGLEVGRRIVVVTKPDEVTGLFLVDEVKDSTDP